MVVEIQNCGDFHKLNKATPLDSERWIEMNSLPDSLIGRQYGKGLSAYALKTIAIIAMVSDHVAVAFVSPESALYHVMRGFGRLTMSTMLFFHVEGYHHTRNIRKYAMRLGLFALISHFPFYRFFTGQWPVYSDGIGLSPTSVIYTLFIGLLALIVWNDDHLKPVPKAILLIGLCVAAIPGDGSFFAVLVILAFEAHRGDFKKQACAFCVMSVANIALGRQFLVPYVYARFLVIPLLRQYNGTLGGGKHSKWFFYVFYPLHLLVLGLLKHGV